MYSSETRQLAQLLVAEPGFIEVWFGVHTIVLDNKTNLNSLDFYHLFQYICRYEYLHTIILSGGERRKYSSDQEAFQEHPTFCTRRFEILDLWLGIMKDNMRALDNFIGYLQKQNAEVSKECWRNDKLGRLFRDVLAQYLPMLKDMRNGLIQF